MTTLRCGKHQLGYETEFYATCPICDKAAFHPDAEDAVSGAIEALGNLYPRRWADAIERDDLQQERSDIAKASAELKLMVDAYCQQLDWPTEKRTTASNHNEARL